VPTNKHKQTLEEMGPKEGTGAAGQAQQQKKSQEQDREQKVLWMGGSWVVEWVVVGWVVVGWWCKCQS